ncbi:type II toxin-antitoxin system RelE/ParE family toxin [Hydrogenimonas sp.]
MRIEFSALYEKQKAKLVKRGRLSQGIVEETEKIFLSDPLDRRLRPHKITCKKDKRRRSITVVNTSYRILYTDAGEIAVFQMIIHHDRYDRINKDC